jgi:hypothetical protein
MLSRDSVGLVLEDANEVCDWHGHQLCCGNGLSLFRHPRWKSLYSSRCFSRAGDDGRLFMHKPDHDGTFQLGGNFPSDSAETGPAVGPPAPSSYSDKQQLRVPKSTRRNAL